MYIVYVADSINVRALAEQWGTVHNKIPNGTEQTIQVALSSQDWRGAISTNVQARNPRVVHFPDAIPEDIAAIELTAMMHDPNFQVIGHISEENVDVLSKRQTELQQEVFDKMFTMIKNDIMESIDVVGVNDRVAWASNSKVTLSVRSKETGKNARALIQNRQAYIRETLVEEFDLASMLQIVGR